MDDCLYNGTASMLTQDSIHFCTRAFACCGFGSRFWSDASKTNKHDEQ